MASNDQEHPHPHPHPHPHSPPSQPQPNITAPNPTTPAAPSDATTPRRGKFLAPPAPASTAPLAAPSPSSAVQPPPPSDTAAVPATAPSAPATPSTKSRGKFLGAVPSAAAAVPSSSTSPPPSGGAPTPGGTSVRGAGKTFPTPSSSSVGHPDRRRHGTLSDAEDASHPSLAALRSRVAAARSSAAQKRRRLGETRERVFRNLDEAEDIVLGLLRCAAEAAGDLRDMTRAGVGAGGSAEETKDDDGSRNQKSFAELAVRVRDNGKAYLAGVRRLHELLAPHADVVKSYRNHRRRDDDIGDVVGDGKSVVDGIIDTATSNMYAARVEMRLAVERREILKEMLRSERMEGWKCEEEVLSDENRDGTEDVAVSGSKRKLEAVAAE